MDPIHPFANWVHEEVHRSYLHGVLTNHFSVQDLHNYPLILASAPGPLFILGFERAWYAKIRHLTSFWTSVGVSMETPPFTMTSFQSAYGQVAAWCEYSSSETDGRIAS